MKVLLYLALIVLATVSCHSDNGIKKETLKCFAKREMVDAIRAIKTGGVQNFIKSKLTLTGLVSSLGSVRQCLATNVSGMKSNGDSVLAKIGMTALYLSNCEKDVGGVFLILDNIVQEAQSGKPDWMSLVIETFMDGMLGY